MIIFYLFFHLICAQKLFSPLTSPHVKKPHTCSLTPSSFASHVYPYASIPIAPPPSQTTSTHGSMDFDTHDHSPQPSPATYQSLHSRFTLPPPPIFLHTLPPPLPQRNQPTSRHKCKKGLCPLTNHHPSASSSASSTPRQTDRHHLNRTTVQRSISQQTEEPKDSAPSHQSFSQYILCMLTCCVKKSQENKHSNQ